MPGGTGDGAPIINGADGTPLVAEQEYHGTKVHGCLFGDGTGSTIPGAKGMIPDAQSIVATYCTLSENDLSECQGVTPKVSRTTHTQDLVALQAVFQSNSWGSGHGSGYGISSAELDRIIRSHDLLVCQCQGNSGTTESVVEAWAKNVVSVGGIKHKNTLTKGDDEWNFGASIGSASDGPIKPDLAHFYDAIYTTTHDGGYISGFGGTSAATPITCGYFGLFFQMWHEGVFPGFGGGASVFASRPRAATAKAMLINTAEQYFFDSSTHDKTRTHQGWGLPSAGKLYKLRNQFPVIIDGTQILTSEQRTATYSVSVTRANTFSLKATLVYSDPAGPPYSTQPTVNDLDLKVISPSLPLTEYFGNNGLRTGNWSTAGGISDTDAFDTVENVFINFPDPGTWTVEVSLDPVLQRDIVNIDFGLVVSLDYDCNHNIKSDAEDIVKGLANAGSADYDNDGVPDECQTNVYVDAAVIPPGGNGTTWALGYSNLQAAIDAAQPGNRVMVKAGEYGPVALKNGVAVYGGFAGTETATSQANYRVNVTNIVGNGSSPHVVTSVNNGPGTILRGVYVKNGNANGSTGNDAHGGGLYLENSNAKFVQCVFTNNDAAGNGAAVANMKIAGGTAGNPTFVNCAFHRNKDVDFSGEILKGGAVYSEAGNPQFVNCLFHKNEARNGGAIYIQAGQPQFLNCTISDNLANKNGGGIYNNTGQPTLRNSIVYFNDGGLAGPQIHNPGSGTITATYTDVQGGWTGQGNISDLPQFTDRFADNYTLLGSSPCPDAGRNSDLPADPSDIDWDGDIAEQLPNDLAAPLSGPLPGDLRIGNCIVGMGAFEIQGLCSAP